MSTSARFSRDRHLQDDTGIVSVLGDHADAAGRHRPGGSRSDLGVRHSDRAALDRHQAGEHVGECSLAVALHPCHADDLPGANLQAQVVEQGPAVAGTQCDGVDVEDDRCVFGVRVGNLGALDRCVDHPDRDAFGPQ